jgi:sarcosine oxidase subunit alpha
MSAQPFRLAEGGAIDRTAPLAFTFDGKRYGGYGGDTLASALLANGVRLVGRSFKYHRPRGVFTAGPEEPNALVRLRAGERAEPNTRATMVELFDGLAAESQNRWPSLGFDVGAISNALAGLFPAGFYYKTFMGPGRSWLFYERFIRKAAGLGRAPDEPDPDHYEKRYAHCDVLVVGGGPAGIAAALAPVRAGARVILCDERAAFGGSLLSERRQIDGKPAREWLDHSLAELRASGDVVLLRRTTAFGFYDHNLVALVERVADHLREPPAHAPRQRLWAVRARQVVLATGAIERPIVFADNDRPGVMLAAAARAYANQYAVRPGARAVVFANNDDGYRTARDLNAAGVTIAAVVDARAESGAAEAAKRDGIAVRAGSAVLRALGGKSVAAALVASLDAAGGVGAPERIECDLICVSGGWNPAIHLHSQSGGRTLYDEALATYLPGAAKQATRCAGAARGRFALQACLEDGFAAGAAAAHDTGFGSGVVPTAPSCDDAEPAPPRALWMAPAPPGRKRKRFVDIQDDVTVADIELAARENYRSVEHLKRYTTLGMGTDQGKTANVHGLAIMAALRGEPVGAVGHTTFRPPYTPVALGALAGSETDKHFMPIRRTPMHDWHVANGAAMMETGAWLRAAAYPRGGESLAEATAREARHVREQVGLVDVSTLGKIDVQGPDADLLIDRVYCNAMVSLPVGKARYGLMLREDGIVFDDGTLARLEPTRFFMTTTTANAARVLQHLEHLLQVVWPELRCHVTSVTEQWAALALAGPKSRAVLEAAAPGLDASDAAFPFMGVREALIGDVPVRVFRISFSGELAYEIYAPADYGAAVWEALLLAGAAHGVIPYGLEAMSVLRIEKGHVAGPELDGRTTAADLGLGRMVSAKKADFIGRAMLRRPVLRDPGRLALVGLVPVDGKSRLRGGAQLAEQPGAPGVGIGHVTSAAVSPNLGHPIALALVAGGAARLGQTLFAEYPLRGETVQVKVVNPMFYDPEGKRLHG